MLRTTLSVIGSLLLVVGLLGFAPAPEGLAAVNPAPAVGEEDLFNLAPVYNFNFAADNGGNVDQQGTDIEFFSIPDGEGGEQDWAVVGDHSDGVYLFDITDPEDIPEPTYQPCANPRNDVGVKQWTESDGTLRTIIGLSMEGDGDLMCSEADPEGSTFDDNGVAMFDVTDPTTPKPFATISVGKGGAHNFVFHPTAPVAYVWNGELARGAYDPVAVSTIQMIDLRPAIDEDHADYTGDGEDMVALIGPQTLGSVHDGEISPDGNLLYVASENNYEIFSIAEDPFDPVRLGAYVPNPGTYAHGYFPTASGDVSITNNESLALGGFFYSGTTVCPGEGLGFYDSSDPANVIGPVGYYVPPVYGHGPDHRACTSHFGRVVYDNDVVMTLGWYILGTRVVDFSDPANPIEIGAATLEPTGGEHDAGTEAWAAKTYKGKPYVFVGDQGRGFDVFRWTGDPACGNPFDDTYVPNCLEGRGPGDTTTEPPALMRSLSASAAVAPRELTTFRFSCQV